MRRWKANLARYATQIIDAIVSSYPGLKSDQIIYVPGDEDSWLEQVHALTGEQREFLKDWIASYQPDQM